MKGPVEVAAPAGPAAEEVVAAGDEAATDAAPSIEAVQEQLPVVESVLAAAADQGKNLYVVHCASCHGNTGDGNGLAAPFLFPKPRNLRAGRFRLVSTDNSVPTREDLAAVLERGMPGSAMPPWRHLTQEQRDALVDEVIRIRREGVRDEYVQQLKDDEGLTDEDIAEADVQEEIDDYVDELTTPGKSTEVPSFQSPTGEAIAQGKEAYVKFACVSCHGETGRGDGVQEMFDDEKMPTRPRDFTLGIFKGNHDESSIYRRIAYGMPGTPMPGSSTMTPEQMVNLVHYIRSLSTEEQRQAAIPRRETIVAQRVDAIPQSAEQDAWENSKAIPIRVFPLWWRDEADPVVRVQALHDGDSLALRLSWADATRDDYALRSESFEDAAAVQMFRGPTEPFLGMGDRSSPVDMWFWDSDRQHGQMAVKDQYPNAVVDIFPFSEKVATSTDLDRPGARMSDQPDVSMPARASGNQIVPPAEGAGGSSLHAAGPRTITFRPKENQLVKATGEWQDGRWTVVLTRPLSTPSEADGVSLKPGETASTAFALWNGSRQDRNGQKLISIWHDLKLAP